ncbi:MAG: hypothetical protein IJT31_03155 [Oscillibacter sp.]|nr:hypothetical protein [Oscillibacter sp.]
MYNRYIRNDRGTYTRITEDDAPRRPPPRPEASGPPHNPPESPHGPRPESAMLPHNPPEAPHGPPPEASPPHRPPEMSPPPPVQDGLQGFLRHLLQVSHAENVDTGDLLLLCLLFLLYREGADEELLVALGLLLIL